jgi:hypothetical protein
MHDVHIVSTRFNHVDDMPQPLAALRLHPYADELKQIILTLLKRHGFLNRYLHQQTAQLICGVPIVATIQLQEQHVPMETQSLHPVATCYFRGLRTGKVEAGMLGQSLRVMGDDFDAQFAQHTVRPQYSPNQ